MTKRNQTWIIDGHNVVFAVPGLERLQSSGQRREARESLIEACRTFAATRQERVVIFFDGVPGFTEGAEDSTLLEVAFAPYEGKADDRIVLRSDRLITKGSRVTVATDDQDLRHRLHRNVAAIGSKAFWQLTRPKRSPTGEQIPKIPLGDVEAYFLSREEAVIKEIKQSPIPKIKLGREPKRKTARVKPKTPSTGPPAATPPAPPSGPPPPGDRRPEDSKTLELSAETRLQQKKERGRKKQEKRLARMQRTNRKRN